MLFCVQSIELAKEFGVYEDSYLEAAYEDRFEAPDYDFNGPWNPESDDDDGGPDDDYEPDFYLEAVDDSFPMYLEYEGPFGLSGYDEY